jgi:hypothetical protein
LTDLGHARADTLITPLNDSFLDIDVLARIDRQRRLVLGPSGYAQMVSRQSEHRVANGQEPIDWLVMRNRLAQLDARNTRDMAGLLGQLDLPADAEEARFNPSRWNARREIRDLLDVAVTRRATRHYLH